MEYAKCLVELNELLGHLEKESLEKIPYDIREAIVDQMDKSYSWSYDETKGLEEQNLDRKTIAMLSYLNMEYLLNKEQKELMEEYHKLNEKREREKNQANYNNLSSQIKAEDIEVSDEKVALVEVTSHKWYEKIVSFFSNTFKK